MYCTALMFETLINGRPGSWLKRKNTPQTLRLVWRISTTGVVVKSACVARLPLPLVARFEDGFTVPLVARGDLPLVAR